jgi:4-diphosphocytidyl-2-C-methyl-D-erythritol kinase
VTPILVARAPGKVNLSLFVGVPRADGLHPLVSVVQSVSLADELTLSPAPDGAAADEVLCAGVDGPNLAARALAAFRAATGWDAPPQRLEIVKRVPVAAGMGGGSGDAAAVLRLAAHAAGGASAALLHRLAVTLGADVPSQLEPGRVLMSGAGERVEPLPPAAPFGLVLVPSAHTLATPDVYRAFDGAGGGRSPAALERAAAAARAGGSPPPVNDLQDAARALCPAIDDVLADVRAVGAATAMVSGSGPTVFGVFETPEAAQAAAQALGARHPQAVAAEPVESEFGQVRAMSSGGAS